MTQIQAPVVIIGSGIGGATTAYALAKRGIEVLIVERGDYLPVEPENWSEHAIFIDKRYKPKETWLDEKGKEFVPGVHYFVGGNSKVYGAALPRFRASDFDFQRHLQGDSPAWPFNYSDIEPFYSEAEALYKVHGTPGIDPTDPPRSQNYPFPSLPHEPYVQKLDSQLRQSDYTHFLIRWELILALWANVFVVALATALSAKSVQKVMRRVALWRQHLKRV